MSGSPASRARWILPYEAGLVLNFSFSWGRGSGQAVEDTGNGYMAKASVFSLLFAFIYFEVVAFICFNSLCLYFYRQAMIKISPSSCGSQELQLS